MCSASSPSTPALCSTLPCSSTRPHSTSSPEAEVMGTIMAAAGAARAPSCGRMGPLPGPARGWRAGCASRARSGDSGYSSPPPGGASGQRMAQLRGATAGPGSPALFRRDRVTWCQAGWQHVSGARLPAPFSAQVAHGIRNGGNSCRVRQLQGPMQRSGMQGRCRWMAVHQGGNRVAERAQAAGAAGPQGEIKRPPSRAARCDQPPIYRRTPAPHN